MKIKVKQEKFENVINKSPKKKKIKKPSFLFALLIRILSIFELKSVKFQFKGSIKPFKKQACLILMNHSCFLDLKIASKILFPKKYFIVCTTDGFVGKEFLMRKIGCIPTQKFVSSLDLIADMNYCLKHLKTSVLLFPEAGYTFDGKATVMPKRLGLLVKKLNVPVVSIITDGAFLHQPLYNNLRLRKNKVTANVKCLVSLDQVKQLSVGEIDKLIEEQFSFDGFQSQFESKVVIDDKNRAEGLERILYKCPHCEKEDSMLGKGDKITCSACGATYSLTELGKLKGENVCEKFTHVPDWYNWQRDCAREELLNDYKGFELDVDIKMITDYKALYSVGQGKLKHDLSGFTLIGCDGKLNYFQPSNSSYCLNSDFFWYEIGDVISIGDKEKLFYCFPKLPYPVAKARLLVEELYKLFKENKLSGEK